MFFFELINQLPHLADTYQFSSVEIKQLAFRIDGVFLPAADAPELPLYFAELQFQADKKFSSRFFAEILNYLDKVIKQNSQKQPRLCLWTFFQNAFII